MPPSGNGVTLSTFAKRYLGKIEMKDMQNCKLDYSPDKFRKDKISIFMIPAYSYLYYKA